MCQMGVMKMPILDNSDLFEQHDAEQEQQLRRLPVCIYCKHPIQQEKAVCVDGCWVCEDCEDKAWEQIRNEFLEEIEL